MAQLIFTIPDDQVGRVIDGIAGFFGYSPVIMHGLTQPPTPNPESKSEFARRMVREHMIGCVTQFESSAAAEAARLAAQQSADGIVITG